MCCSLAVFFGHGNLRVSEMISFSVFLILVIILRQKLHFSMIKQWRYIKNINIILLSHLKGGVTGLFLTLSFTFL